MRILKEETLALVRRLMERESHENFNFKRRNTGAGAPVDGRRAVMSILILKEETLALVRRLMEGEKS